MLGKHGNNPLLTKCIVPTLHEFTEVLRRKTRYNKRFLTMLKLN